MTHAITWSGTFHAIGRGWLREFADRIGLDRAFTIHDREDSADLLNSHPHDLGYSMTEKRFPTKNTCLAIYSRAVNAECPLEEVLGAAFAWCAGWEAELRALYAAYVEAKQRQHVLDYDDLLLYWAHMMAEPAIAAEVGSRFDHVLVDEYQDTNRLQASVLLALKPDGKGLTIVGDDAQSIYSFRAATVRKYPGLSRPIYPARCGHHAGAELPLDPADPCRRQCGDRPRRRTLHQEPVASRASAERPRLVSVADEAGQAGYVVERVLEHREAGIALKAQAVLFRASHHSGPLEVELTRRNIPFVKFGGLKFLEAAHIKDVLALLRFAGNPRDRVAGFRVLQLLPGVGPATAGRALDHVAGAGDPATSLAGFSPASGGADRLAGLCETLGMVRAVPPDGRPNSTASAAGMRRTSSASTRTPPCAKPIWCSFRRSRRAIRAGSAS